MRKLIENDIETDEKTGKYKVDRLFKKLKQPALERYFNITKPVDQAEAIVKFAELVGVPRSRLAYIFKQMKAVSGNAVGGNAPLNTENISNVLNRKLSKILMIKK